MGVAEKARALSARLARVRNDAATARAKTAPEPPRDEAAEIVARLQRDIGSLSLAGLRELDTGLVRAWSLPAITRRGGKETLRVVHFKLAPLVWAIECFLRERKAATSRASRRKRARESEATVRGIQEYSDWRARADGDARLHRVLTSAIAGLREDGPDPFSTARFLAIVQAHWPSPLSRAQEQIVRGYAAPKGLRFRHEAAQLVASLAKRDARLKKFGGAHLFAVAVGRIAPKLSGKRAAQTDTKGP